LQRRWYGFFLYGCRAGKPEFPDAFQQIGMQPETGEWHRAYAAIRVFNSSLMALMKSSVVRKG